MIIKSAVKRCKECMLEIQRCSREKYGNQRPLVIDAVQHDWHGAKRWGLASSRYTTAYHVFHAVNTGRSSAYLSPISGEDQGPLTSCRTLMFYQLIVARRVSSLQWYAVEAALFRWWVHHRPRNTLTRHIDYRCRSLPCSNRKTEKVYCPLGLTSFQLL